MLRKFLSDSAVYTIPNFVSSGLAILLVPLYTRVLTREDYGSFDLFFAFLAIVKLTIALEVSQGLARYYAQEKSPDQQVKLASTAFWFTAAVYAAFAGLCAVNASHLAEAVMGRPGLKTTFLIGLVYLWFNGVFYLIQNQFRWELRSKAFACVSLLMTLVTVVSCVTLAYGCSLGLDGLLLGMSIGSAVGVVVGFWMLRNTFRLVFDTNLLRMMLLFSIPFVPSGLAVWATAWIDRVMISHYLTIGDVGLYGIGSRVAGIAGIAISGVVASVTPLVFRHYDAPEAPSQIARIFRFFMVVVILNFLFLTLFARDILKLLTTPGFYAGEVVVIYLVPANILALLYVFTPGISIRNKTHLIVWINLMGGALSILLNFFLIPALGIVGAALANLLGRIAVFACYALISQRLYPIPFDWGRIGCVTCLAVAFAAIVPTISEVDWVRWILSIAAMACLVLSFPLLGLIKRSEIAEARKRMGLALRLKTA